MYAHKANIRVAVRGGSDGKATYQLGTIKQRRNGFYHVQLDSGDKIRTDEQSIVPITNNRVVKKVLTDAEFQVMFLKHKPPTETTVATEWIRNFVAQASNPLTQIRARKPISTSSDVLITAFKRQLAVFQSYEKFTTAALIPAMQVSSGLNNFNRLSDLDRTSALNALSAFRATNNGKAFLQDVVKASISRTLGSVEGRGVAAIDASEVKYRFPSLAVKTGGDATLMSALVCVELAEADYPDLDLADARALVPAICGGIQNVVLGQVKRLKDTCEITLGYSLFETGPVVMPLESKAGVLIGVRYTVTTKLSIK